MRQPPTKCRPALSCAFFFGRAAAALSDRLFFRRPPLYLFLPPAAPPAALKSPGASVFCVFCRHRPRAAKHIHPTNPTNKGHPLMRYYRSAGCFFQDGACRKSSLHVQSSPSSSRSSRNVFFTRMHALLYVPPAMAKNSNTAKGRIKRNGTSFA